MIFFQSEFINNNTVLCIGTVASFYVIYVILLLQDKLLYELENLLIRNGGEAKNAGGESKNAGGESKNAGGESKNAGGEAKNAGGECKNAGGEAKNESFDLNDITTEFIIEYVVIDAEEKLTKSELNSAFVLWHKLTFGINPQNGYKTLLQKTMNDKYIKSINHSWDNSKIDYSKLEL